MSIFKLLKGGTCYSPDPIGVMDILLVYGKICRMGSELDVNGLWDIEILDCHDSLVCPGLLDQHLHIIGGGGEEGPISRIPELMAGEIAAAGVSTVVGVLGADSMTRTVSNLLAKARALDAEGLTAYIYTGSYSLPTATLTGRVVSDLVMADKVIGVGEIALSDHRSSHPSLQMLLELASETRLGGLLGGKAGILHLHLGDGKEGLAPLVQLVQNSDFPAGMFVPTHLNRNRMLFEQALLYGKDGGNLDLTAGEKTNPGLSVPDALELLHSSGMDMNRVTVSSDGNGSVPAGNSGSSGVGKVGQLLQDLRDCIQRKHLDTSVILKTATCNVAKLLGLYPVKGSLSIGSDGDILVLDRETLNIRHMLCRGEIFMTNGSSVKTGRFE